MPNVQGIPVKATVDGMLQAAGLWVKAMNSILNRSDLRRATLLSWRQTLAPRGVVRTHRAWCPMCLNDFVLRGETVYEPLVWRVADVVVCPHHCVHLEVECPYCRRGWQPSFAAFTRVGCCRGCGRWLGRVISGGAGPIDDREIFVSRTVEDTLSLSNVREEIELISSDVAVRALRDVFFCGSSAQMGRALGFLPSQIVHFVTGTFPAPLGLFVRASYATGATMEQIFVTNKFEADGSERRMPQFEVVRSVPRRLQLGSDLVMRLNSALAEGGKQSVSAVAAGLNVTATTVWRRERALASRLAQMHAEFVAMETQARKEEYRAKVIVFISTCAARGITPGRRQVDKECGGVGQFSTEWKGLVIKEALQKVSLVASAH